MQFPRKLIDGPRDLALLTSALLDHELDVLVVKDADEVALRVAVVDGDVVHLEDVPETETDEGKGQREREDVLRSI